MMGPGTLVSFGNILSGLAKRLGLETRLLELRLQHRWHDLVGEPMASHTWPVHIRFKKLHLIVRNSVWLQQLTFLKPALLTKLQAETSPESVTDIVFRVGEIPQPVEVAPTMPPIKIGSGSGEESLVEVASHTAAIQDPALREHFRRVISTYPVQTPSPPVKDPSRGP